MPISDVLYQHRALCLLRRAIASERAAHAYIFHGPDGVGKELLAKRFARLLLCESPVVIDVDDANVAGESHRDACGKCRSCHLVDVDNHPDLHMVFRQLNAHHPDSTVRGRKALQLGVEVIRYFLIDAVGITPACNVAKVFIVREADLITDSAQNALLKTLEEPPATTFLILLANSLERLLPTTRSRCQAIEFSPLPTSFVAEKLTQLVEGLPREQAAFYAALAQGSIGAAMEYVRDNLYSMDLQLAPALAGLSAASAPAVAGQIMDFAKVSSAAVRERLPELSDTAAQRRALRSILTLIATWYRDRLHALTGTGLDAVCGRALREKPMVGLEVECAAKAIHFVAVAESQLDLNANSQLCMESLLFKLAAL